MPFAQSINFDLLRLSLSIIGKTETSAPVSTRNLIFEDRSLTNKQRILASVVPCADDIPGVFRGLCVIPAA